MSKFSWNAYLLLKRLKIRELQGISATLFQSLEIKHLSKKATTNHLSLGFLIFRRSCQQYLWHLDRAKLSTRTLYLLYPSARKEKWLIPCFRTVNSDTKWSQQLTLKQEVMILTIIADLVGLQLLCNNSMLPFIIESKVDSLKDLPLPSRIKRNLHQTLTLSKARKSGVVSIPSLKIRFFQLWKTMVWMTFKSSPSSLIELFFSRIN